MSLEKVNEVFDDILKNEESETSILVNAYDQARDFQAEVIKAFKASPTEDSKQMLIEASGAAIYVLSELCQHLLNDEYVKHPWVRARMVASLLADDVCLRDFQLSAENPTTPPPKRTSYISDELETKIIDQMTEKLTSGEDYPTVAAEVANDIVGRYEEYTMDALDKFIRYTIANK